MTAPAKPPAGVTQQQRSVGAERGSWGRRTRVVFQSGARRTRFYWHTQWVRSACRTAGGPPALLVHHDSHDHGYFSLEDLELVVITYYISKKKTDLRGLKKYHRR